MARILLDFETMSECDLRTEGAYRYAMHASTEIVCASYDLGGGPRIWRGPGHPVPEPFPHDLQMALQEAEVWAHNAAFDRLIFEKVLQRRRPGVPSPSAWRCSMILARTCGIPESLDGCAIALGLEHVKDKMGKILISKISKLPRKAEPSMEMFERMCQYCAQDVRVLGSIVAALPDLSKAEWALYELTETMNRRGVEVDIEFCRKAIEMAEVEKLRLTKRALKACDHAFSSLGQVAAILAWARERGVKIKTLRKEEVSRLLTRRSTPKPVRTVLAARLACGRSSIKKYNAAIDRTCDDGRLRGEMQYYGAQTGRWSCRGVQLHNIIRGGISEMDMLVESLKDDTYPLLWDESVLRLLSWATRGMLRAKQGHKFVAFDYASIEARGVLWLSGSETGLQAFRDGADIYKVMASRIYGVPVESIEKGSQERMVGKTAILGLGYSMGWQRFQEQCYQQSNIRLSDNMAQQTVNAYRSMFAEVPRMWRKLSDAAVRAVANGDTTLVEGTSIRFQQRGRFLFCQLPSRRTLRFFDPSIFEEQTAYRRWTIEGEKQDRLYGGKLMENVVSGLCRDVMAKAVLALERAGYNPVLTVHDEIVLEVPEFVTQEEIGVVMRSAVPAWAEGLPVASESWEGKRYRK